MYVVLHSPPFLTGENHVFHTMKTSVEMYMCVENDVQVCGLLKVSRTLSNDVNCIIYLIYPIPRTQIVGGQWHSDYTIHI